MNPASKRDATSGGITAPARAAMVTAYQSPRCANMW
jgi:hypothetical protein